MFEIKDPKSIFKFAEINETLKEVNKSWNKTASLMTKEIKDLITYFFYNKFDKHSQPAVSIHNERS